MNLLLLKKITMKIQSDGGRLWRFKYVSTKANYIVVYKDLIASFSLKMRIEIYEETVK